MANFFVLDIITAILFAESDSPEKLIYIHCPISVIRTDMAVFGHFESSDEGLHRFQPTASP